MRRNYQRYLLGVFRDNFRFGEVPIKLYLRKRESRAAPGEGVAGESDATVEAGGAHELDAIAEADAALAADDSGDEGDANFDFPAASHE